MMRLMTEETIKSVLLNVKKIGPKREEQIALAIELAAFLLEASKAHLSKKENRRNQLFSRLMQSPNDKALITAMSDGCFRTKDPKRIVEHLESLISQYGKPSFLTKTQRFFFAIFRKIAHFFPRLAVFLLQRFLRKEMSHVILPGEEKALNKRLKQYSQAGIRVNLNRLGEAILGEDESKKRLQICIEDLNNPLVPVISVKISAIFSQINLVAHKPTLEALKERLRVLYRACKEATPHKFVNLDMEEYKDLYLTCTLFQEVLSEPEFFNLSAGLALQSYIPESFQIQKELTEWAEKRIQKNGAPIRLRIVKGANLGMEQVEASIKGFPQAPYTEKIDTDANFKRMIEYGMMHTDAVELGIASHNLFDISYAMILRSQYNVEEKVTFELLEGMANHIQKVVHNISGSVLLYCPAAKKEEFHTAQAYLMRRLDENTHKDNFLPYLFTIKEGSPEWQKQVAFFEQSFYIEPSSTPRRSQNRFQPPLPTGAFSNEPDTDWSLPQNQAWADKIIQTKCTTKSYPKESIATIEKRIEEAKSSSWSALSKDEKVKRFKKLAELLRIHRIDLIGAIVAETQKIIPEADSEVSEAIDMAEYYAQILSDCEETVTPSTIALVVTPWNFPCSIPTSGILAAFAAGDNVLFKPAPEAEFVGHLLFDLFIQANIPLTIITCSDEPEGSYLVQHPDIHTIILTGATATAKKFLSMHPTVKLYAETGGKNTMIVTKLADRDLACRDIVQSSFGYSGQKCSACSLVICEEEVYNDPHFRSQLVDAAKSLVVNSALNLSTKVNPLICDPSPHLLRALTRLEPGEKWLLKPIVHPDNPRLWSPGIKLGVQKNSFTYETELFGPVIGIMCAKDLKEAIDLANGTAYGLTAGLHSLDPLEHALWTAKIEAGNLYINRGITGAIVARQPFGGCKASSFGIGMKSGYKNYIYQFLDGSHFKKESYKIAWDEYFSKTHRLTDLVGQENLLFYRSHPKIFVYREEGEDISLLEEAASITKTELIVGSPSTIDTFTAQIFSERGCPIRCISPPPKLYAQEWVKTCSMLDMSAPSPCGRIELMRFVREVSLSYDYHRYGNLNTMCKLFRAG